MQRRTCAKSYKNALKEGRGVLDRTGRLSDAAVAGDGEAPQNLQGAQL
jgi:hypothetical protein